MASYPGSHLRAGKARCSVKARAAHSFPLRAARVSSHLPPQFLSGKDLGWREEGAAVGCTSRPGANGYGSAVCGVSSLEHG